MKRKLGILLIGQTPRKDYEEIFSQCLNEGDELIMEGVLDEFSARELKNMGAEGNLPVLATLDRNGNQIVIADHEIVNRVPGKIQGLKSKGADIVVVVCTGKFPEMNIDIPIVFPDKVLRYNTKAVAEGKNVAIFIPLEEQKMQMSSRWTDIGVIPVVHAVSPFTEDVEVSQDIIDDLNEKDVAVVVLDCMKFGQAAKSKIQEATGKPVICARTLLLKIVSELMGK
ncbi:MAG: AroM family protein [Clostridiaceae bacterium]|nr:AroM family protein [Clostridiaceae bacterium]